MALQCFFLPSSVLLQATGGFLLVVSVIISAECSGAEQSHPNRFSFSHENSVPKIKVVGFNQNFLQSSGYSVENCDGDGEFFKVPPQEISLGQGENERSEYSIPSFYTRAIIECKSGRNDQLLEWELPKRLNLSEVQIETIRLSEKNRNSSDYLHKSLLILNRISDSLTGEYKCKAVAEKEKEELFNSFYLFVPSVPSPRSNSQNNEEASQHSNTPVIYVTPPFEIKVGSDDDDGSESVVHYDSESTHLKFAFPLIKGVLEVRSTPNRDQQANITVFTNNNYPLSWEFVLIDEKVNNAKGLSYEKIEDLHIFKCRSVTDERPVLMSANVNKQGCQVQLDKQVVETESCGKGCAMYTTRDHRGIIKCIGHGVDEELKFPSDLFCAESPYLLERGSDIQVVPEENSTFVTIPCTVNHPGVTLTLGKLYREFEGQIDWEDVPVGVDGVTFDPKYGFRVQNTSYKSFYGTYLCISDRSLLDWNDHSIVTVKPNHDVTSNSIEIVGREGRNILDDESEFLPEDQELYMHAKPRRSNEKQGFLESLKYFTIPYLEYPIHTTHKFVCHGSRKVFAWGIRWNIQFKNGSILPLEPNLAYETIFNRRNNKEDSQFVWSEIEINMTNTDFKSLWCHAPILNTVFEWRKISWPLLVKEKDAEQSVRISYLEAPAETLQRIWEDNRITTNDFIAPLDFKSMKIVSDSFKPLTWVYEGEYPPNSISVSNSRDNTDLEDLSTYSFTSEMYLQNLSPSNTGRYTVINKYAPERNISFYLFVPSERPPFFLKSLTENIVSVENTPGYTLIIPCLVNNPALRVTIYKSSGHRLTDMSSSFSYDPRIGFSSRHPVASTEKVLGSYLCMARSRGSYQVDKTTFTVVGNEPPFFLKSTSGKIVTINNSAGSKLVIPCMVYNPKLRLSIYKSTDEKFKDLTSSFTYDPKVGFSSKIPVASQEDAIGVYLCVASSTSNQVDRASINVVAKSHLRIDIESHVHWDNRLLKLYELENIRTKKLRLDDQYDDQTIVFEGTSMISGSMEVKKTGIQNNPIPGLKPLFRDVTLKCSVSKFTASNGIKWAVRTRNDTLEFYEDQLGDYTDIDDRISSELEATYLDQEVQSVHCYIPLLHSYAWEYFTFDIDEIMGFYGV